MTTDKEALHAILRGTGRREAVASVALDRDQTHDVGLSDAQLIQAGAEDPAETGARPVEDRGDHDHDLCEHSETFSSSIRDRARRMGIKESLDSDAMLDALTGRPLSDEEDEHGAIVAYVYRIGTPEQKIYHPADITIMRAEGVRDGR